ncbi:class III signal peptide-containing protein [Candidatus Woesearchaeota archaeon]|nr:class III signal peptide-containing protein [Candidatus Woesearchaeota archaeon]
MKKRGQVALEYMILIGLTTVIVIFLLVMSNYYSKGVENTINTNQIDRMGKELIDKAESMYYFGQPSRTTVKAFIPKGIESINITSNEINFRVKTEGGTADMFYSSFVPLKGNITSSYGLHYIIIEAREGYVWINGT